MPNFGQRLNMSGGGKEDASLANESPYSLLNKLESQLGYFADASVVLRRIEQESASTFEQALFSRSEFTPARFDERILESERLCRIVVMRALEASTDSQPFDETSLNEVELTDIEDVFEKIDNHTQTQITESALDSRIGQRYNSEELLQSAYAYLNHEIADQTLLHQIGYAGRTGEHEQNEWIPDWKADLLALPMIIRSAKRAYQERVDQLGLRFDGGKYPDWDETPVWDILLVMITIVLLGRGFIDSKTAIAVILGILAQLRQPSLAISIPELEQNSDLEPTVFRSLLTANPRSWVAIFPKGTSEIDLFRDFDCWGSLRSLFRSNPSFIAIYEGGNKGKIEYFADVMEVTTAKKFSRYSHIRNFSCVNKQEKLLTITNQSKLAQPIVSNGSYIRSPRGRFVRLGVFRAASQVSDLLNP